VVRLLSIGRPFAASSLRAPPSRQLLSFKPLAAGPGSRGRTCKLRLTGNRSASAVQPARLPQPAAGRRRPAPACTRRRVRGGRRRSPETRERANLQTIAIPVRRGGRRSWRYAREMRRGRASDQRRCGPRQDRRLRPTFKTHQRHHGLPSARRSWCCSARLVRQPSRRLDQQA
jgi:hypothetical protein